MTPTTGQRLIDRFHVEMGGWPTWLVRAPGRVNLIGEHTDYNDGFVLPMAIEQATWIALRPDDSPHLTLHSLDFDQRWRAPLDQLALASPKPSGSAPSWNEYVRGVAWALHAEGYPLRGWRGLLSGELPMGAGLSSSASLEIAIACAFAVVAGVPWAPIRMAQIAQRAENQWVGVNSGIMDPLASASGRAGHALLIDCRSLDIVAVPLPPATTVVVMDTTTRRGLVDSAYNARRAQCADAAARFGVAALREVSVARFEAEAPRLAPTTRRRARHVVTENARTVAASEAMRRGEAVALGRLMNGSHRSLRDDFEVSSEALDRMVALAQADSACYGARMTGAGFGGCAVALVAQASASAFCARVAARYQAATGQTPQLIPCQPAQGAQAIALAP